VAVGCQGRVAWMHGIARAVAEGDLGEVERLVGEDPILLDTRDGRGMTLLMLASWHSHVGVVRWLLDRGAAINEREDCGCTALWVASSVGRLPVVRRVMMMVLLMMMRMMMIC
jgi:ankyrin repeat protein